MIKNRKLSKSISDVSWGMLTTMLKYKADEAKVMLVEASQFFPSTQLCSHCGSYPDEKLKLRDRQRKCIHCGLDMDRDINAAINLRKYASYIVAFTGFRPYSGVKELHHHSYEKLKSNPYWRQEYSLA